MAKRFELRSRADIEVSVFHHCFAALSIPFRAVESSGRSLKKRLAYKRVSPTADSKPTYSDFGAPPTESQRS
uniref:Uncharacterized protein n=1 Tax=Trichuris muris TaxID=70415 RepID=A0A5S6PYH6_TRIMR